MKLQTRPVCTVALLCFALIARSIAPNILGSPSMTSWVANAFDALYSGTGSSGTAGTPAFYSVAPSVIPITDVLVTSFPSWHGLAHPGTTVGPAFAAEQGNRLHFSVLIDGHGQEFSISQLSFAFTSSDTENVLGFTRSVGFYNYEPGYVGVRFGTDGQLGGGDDTFVTSGGNTQLVNALVARGSGNAWWPVHTTGDGLTDQQVLDYAAAAIAPTTPILATGVYSLDLGGGSVFSGHASVTIIPEPATCGLALAGATLAIVLLRRRRVC